MRTQCSQLVPSSDPRLGLQVCDPTFGPVTVSSKFTDNIVRVRLNYHNSTDSHARLHPQSRQLAPDIAVPLNSPHGLSGTSRNVRFEFAAISGKAAGRDRRRRAHHLQLCTSFVFWAPYSVIGDAGIDLKESSTCPKLDLLQRPELAKAEV
jgi:hypothetical protein